MDTIQQLLERELQAKIHTSLQPYMKSIQDRALERIDAVISDIVNQKLQTIDFPDGSIPASKINTNGLRISKSTIQDHVFGAGIEDIADAVQLTVMDGAVVVENDLITNSIKATSVVADTLIVKDFATDQPWYTTMKQDVLASVPKPAVPKDWSFKIAEMDAKIQVNADRNQLNELEVSGEAVLSDVLYTTPGNKRVGINTMEPSDALTVWDQECEVVVGKHANQESYIGTRRRQNINIGANNNVGITVRVDGTVILNKLELLGRTIGSGKAIPGHAAKKGDIVLNDDPTVGGYVGWVCLDGIRWASYGKIE